MGILEIHPIKVILISKWTLSVDKSVAEIEIIEIV